MIQYDGSPKVIVHWIQNSRENKSHSFGGSGDVTSASCVLTFAHDGLFAVADGSGNVSLYKIVLGKNATLTDLTRAGEGKEVKNRL